MAGSASRSQIQSRRRARRHKRLAVIAFSAVVAARVFIGVDANASRTAHAPASPFVSRTGSQLYLNGGKWLFTGYNNFELTSIAVGQGSNCGYTHPVSWLNQMLDEIKNASQSTVIRTWFFQSFAGSNFIQFRTVLDAARARNIKLIPVLVNQWPDCEPWPTSARPYKNLAWYQGGYKQRQDGYALSFRDYARTTAAAFANSSTIAFWQLVNEAEAMNTASGPCQERRAASAIRSFADDVAGAIKAVDHNHLVSLGTIGTGQCGTSGGDYGYINAGRVDICEYHDYVGGAVSGDAWNGLLPDVRQCTRLGKPVFAGEVGIDSSVRRDWWPTGITTATSLVARAGLFAQKMTAQFRLGISGFLIWMKSPGSPSWGFNVGPGDPTEAVLAAEQRHLKGGVP